MRIIFFISFILFFSLTVNTQTIKKYETLDRFFSGTPLKEGFEKWYEFIANHPSLGIDSTTFKGNFSSFKHGINDYFPFPDSTRVRMFFKKTIYVNPHTQQKYDSASIIEVMGVFGFDKNARRESRKFYRGLRRELKTKYRYEYRDYVDQSSWLYRGKTNEYPNCSIRLGYDNNLKSHFVILNYSDQKSLKIKTYLPPDNTLRR